MDILEALVEIETKGTIQEQANKLFDEMYCYKKLIAGVNTKIQNKHYELVLDELYLMRTKYEVRSDYVKNQCCYLNKEIIETFSVIEEFVEFEDFIDLFELNADEIDKEESFYSNLLMNSGKIGMCVRTGLLQNEKIMCEMCEDV
ncbi:hypothetical protein [Clostridium estertheticum]|uniref:Uncharacterized protein n=1 Tax=Clostridium estertheticum TaxID=238834 RepID=A0AA47ELN3_9CLOT|nr:hypothetical protein [Clostridium estertheticum]MBU3153915.1 hypothetical protein [Clostridium estertheticum]WAG61311.1 hypothetical protein LL038_03395 [Clostridium estertheticum]